MMAVFACRPRSNLLGFACSCRWRAVRRRSRMRSRSWGRRLRVERVLVAAVVDRLGQDGGELVEAFAQGAVVSGGAGFQQAPAVAGVLDDAPVVALASQVVAQCGGEEAIPAGGLGPDPGGANEACAVV